MSKLDILGSKARVELPNGDAVDLYEIVSYGPGDNSDFLTLGYAFREKDAHRFCAVEEMLDALWAAKDLIQELQPVVLGDGLQQHEDRRRRALIDHAIRKAHGKLDR